MSKKNVAFIGLGVMGFPMAGHLSNNGYIVNVYNRTKSKADEWRKKYEGNVFNTPAEAAINSNIIMTCVGRDEDLKEVIEGENGIIATTIAIMIMVWAQKIVTPSQTAIFFSLEPLFAALFSWILLGQTLGLVGWAGGLIIIGAILISDN